MPHSPCYSLYERPLCASLFPVIPVLFPVYASLSPCICLPSFLYMPPFLPVLGGLFLLFPLFLPVSPCYARYSSLFLPHRSPPVLLSGLYLRVYSSLSSGVNLRVYTSGCTHRSPPVLNLGYTSECTHRSPPVLNLGIPQGVTGGAYPGGMVVVYTRVVWWWCIPGR